MNNIFSIKRFWSVLKCDFFRLWPLLAASLLFPLAVWAFFVQFQHAPDDGSFHSFFYSEEKVENWLAFSCAMCLVLLLALPSYTFTCFADRKQRFNTLSLPASLLEKMLSRCVFCCVLPAVFYAWHCWNFFHLPVLADEVGETDPRAWPLIFASIWFVALVIFATEVFWSALVKKGVLLISVSAISAVIFAVAKMEGFINMFLFDGIIRYVVSDPLLYNLIYVEAAVLAIYVLACFAASYLVLSRKQIR